MMEKLAQELVAANSVPVIAKVYDQYLDMIALEPNLFSLNIKNSFAAYNAPSLSEAQIRNFMNRTAVGLLSMVSPFYVLNPRVSFSSSSSNRGSSCSVSWQ